MSKNAVRFNYGILTHENTIINYCKCSYLYTSAEYGIGMDKCRCMNINLLKHIQSNQINKSISDAHFISQLAAL